MEELQIHSLPHLSARDTVQVHLQIWESEEVAGLEGLHPPHTCSICIPALKKKPLFHSIPLT